MTKHSGFSLIELVIVVVVLGILAVTALPRFLDVTEEAKNASVEGVAGGFATGVSLTRAQWEAVGRSKEAAKNVVIYDGTKLYLTTPTNTEMTAGTVSPGYPMTNQNEDVTPASLTPAKCESIWNSILQNPPRIASSFSDVSGQGDFYKFYVTTTNGGTDTSCLFYLVNSLDKGSDGLYTDPGSDTGKFKNFTYKPATGQVAANIN
ncbi:prepilin-type N-terminal cleavage/methylation domain-containing protein [Motilimonas cestriensis]|uniref:Prepilin-type N-terminal cleavage/methylation domain-containing protein n=1 Tax=Motilimonas cestriensis TaxID=2742685 RepID=A0ABS8WAG8_9GAMM|nr:prepilin-type N-terminal cleavage/methylation domain-containing protein [Motilimonas cestriensis]MCE2596039.1 prepilin-type N-terminal cleavage/methylation domain-containing protein [Motilimonas cestriensis]